MKHEIPLKTPEGMGEDWPDQFDTFSTLEPRAGIPSLLMLVTTRKEDGKANAALHAWSAFAGDSGGYYAILCGFTPQGHTYPNILREKAFCVNFMPPALLAACEETIRHNGEQEDELEAAGLTREDARTVAAPRVAAGFLSLECELVSTFDPSGLGQMQVIVGRVLHAVRSDAFTGLEGFMAYQYQATDPVHGTERINRFATLAPFEQK